MSDKKIILVGYSGHGFVVADAAIESGMALRFYTETKAVVHNPFDLDYLGFESDVSFKIWNEDYDYILGIGNNVIREKVAHLILSKNKRIQNVIHPSASIAQKITLGQGNFIARNVAVNPLAVIGDFCILNTGCIVEHECTIGNAVHIGPGAVLAGNVCVGEHTFIGANAVVKQGVTIGKGVIVGAGSVVLKDVAEGKIVVGNPAKTKG